jgi:hypothetical protein
MRIRTPRVGMLELLRMLGEAGALAGRGRELLELAERHGLGEALARSGYRLRVGLTRIDDQHPEPARHPIGRPPPYQGDPDTGH